MGWLYIKKIHQEFVPIHILFECASGYALFLAPGINEVQIDKFQSIEEFFNSSPFQLVDAERFSSDAEALFELNAISTCKAYNTNPSYFFTLFPHKFIYILFPCVATLTHKLKDLLDRNLPHPRKNYKLATSDSYLGLAIARNLCLSQVVLWSMMSCVVCGTKFTHSSTWMYVCVPSSSYTHNPFMLYMC